jgi:hypothetical protein
MSWISITDAEILTRISGAELSGFRAAALGTGQVDPVPVVTLQVVEMVRGYIAGCRQNQLGPETTVPEKLIGPTVDLIVVEVEKRAAGSLIDPSGTRRDSQREAMTILRDVAACRFVLEAPDDVTGEAQMTPSPTISAKKPRYRSQSGL